jgi:hypothetical protein
MMPPESMVLRQLAERMLTSAEGSRRDSALVADAARRAYVNLGYLLNPIIGQTGTSALAARAVHLAAQKHHCLTAARNSDQTGDIFEQVAVSLQRQDPTVAIEAGAAVFAAFAGLLVTFIGESVTMPLLHQAWPDAFSDAAGKDGPA